MRERNKLGFALVAAAFSLGLSAQPPQQQGAQGPGIPVQPTNTVRPDYVLGANDQILIHVPQSEEINDRPFRVEADGFITLPLINRVQAAGLTVQALEAALVVRLREFYREPQVFITVVGFRSEPVFVTGDFKTPGIYPLQGRTLVEMLTAAGGLQPNASRRIRITRHAEYGPIPLPNAVSDPEKKVSTVEISLESLTENINPAEDFRLQPYDIISVARAERIYMNGEFSRTGIIELGERSSMSMIQALTEAGGLKDNAARDKIRVLRPILGTNRRAEIDIDLKKILAGKEVDFPLLPNDVVWVKKSQTRAILVPMGTGLITGLPYLLIGLASSGVL